jgi:hypothetical protein
MLYGMASFPLFVPVIQEVPPPDAYEDAEEDSRDGDDAQHLVCTLDLPARCRHDSYRYF